MEKLDRLGWADGIAYRAYGTRVGIRVTEPGFVDRIQSLLPPGWKPAKSRWVERLYSLRIGGASPQSKIRRYNLLYADVQRIARSMSLDEALDVLASDMQFFVAESSRTRVFTHAGVVGWKGRAIVLPGRSFSGKTTLVAALVRAGATYYSDEYALFDARGRVHPYPRPLSIREEHGEWLGRVRAEELGGSVGSRPLPVGLVLVSEYKPGARWRPRKLSPGQAALALLANTVSARLQPKMALATLKRAVARVPTLMGARGEVGEVVETVLSGLDEAA
jgi:hypothetical protein